MTIRFRCPQALGVLKNRVRDVATEPELVGVHGILESREDLKGEDMTALRSGVLVVRGPVLPVITVSSSSITEVSFATGQAASQTAAAGAALAVHFTDTIEWPRQKLTGLGLELC